MTKAVKHCNKCNKDTERYASGSCKACTIKHAKEWNKKYSEKRYLRKHTHKVKMAGGTQQDINGLAFILWTHATDGKLFCHYCSTLLTSAPGPRQRNIEHLDGKSAGNTFANLQTACRTCNSQKGKQPYRQYVSSLGKSFANDQRSKTLFLTIPMIATVVELPRAA